ncbi:MAG: ATP-binding protein [Planctomycetes bacterium]|nr:ATP-binding protein [Planctomycetota bacterium]
MARNDAGRFQRAYELFRASGGSAPIAALNARLQSEGLEPITERMYTHLRDLHEDGFPVYRPANEHEQWRKALRAPRATRIANGLVDLLRDQNPWWSGKPGPPPRTYRRWLFPEVRDSLLTGLTPAVVLRGPRRVGKTILLRQIIEDLLKEGRRPREILYLPFDELKPLLRLSMPVLTLARWFEQNILGCTFNEAARAGLPALLFLDEVQNLDNWAPQVKSLVDNHSVRVLVTGSSSLRIEQGQDSLAGRITTLELGPLLLREIAGLRGDVEEGPYWARGNVTDLLQKEFWSDLVAFTQARAPIVRESFARFSERGAYPFAHDGEDAPWEKIAAFLQDTVIKRAIQHDLRTGERGRKRDEDLLSEVMKLACRYAGQAPAVTELARQVNVTRHASLGSRRVGHYIEFLDRTLLIRLVKPIEIRLRKRHSPSRICVSCHSIRAAWLGEVVSLDPHVLRQHPESADLAGHLAESTLGYFLSTIPIPEVRWQPEREGHPEVDLVLGVGDRWIPIEVKYKAKIDPFRDAAGLRAFLDRPSLRAPFGLLVTREPLDPPWIDDRILALPLSSILWMR